MGTSTLRKIIDFTELAKLRDRFAGKRIVQCHGVFDLLHPGHLAYLDSAKRRGDMLVVTVTSDEYVGKGPGRPHFPLDIRMKMLAALELVDFVAPSPNSTAVAAIECLKPHFYVKGPDYQDGTKDPTGGIYLEEQAVKRFNGELAFTEDAVFSSSSLLNQFFNSRSEEQLAAIERINQDGGLAAIEEVLERIALEDVIIVGEPIVDTYVFCTPEAISIKGSAVSAHYNYEENYAGGALAVANHVVDFAKSCALATTHGNEPYFKQLLHDKLDLRVQLAAQELHDIPTPRKIRYIGDGKVQRLFEITNINANQWTHHPAHEFSNLLREHARDRSALLVADFGHGLIEGDVLTTLAAHQGFIGLNVQTNSSNYAFNLFPKHKKFSYLSIDTKEARLAYRDRSSSAIDLSRRIRRDYAAQGVTHSMTLGPAGSFYFPSSPSDREIAMPAFSGNVVDAIGAGDAYFAITALLSKTGCPDLLVPFVGNVFAGLKTQIVGNKNSVTRAQLLKTLRAILK